MNARCTRLPQVNGIVLTAGRSGPLRNASIYIGSDSSSVQGNLLVAVRACLPACLPAAAARYQCLCWIAASLLANLRRMVLCYLPITMAE
jgi:hypothetical protein